MAFMKKSTRRAIAKYWGYMLLPVLFYGWFVRDIGYGPLAIASTLASAFFLFQVKAPCCADNREVKSKSGDPTYCRNNAKGILRGCHIVAHRWQNAKMIGHRSLWGRLALGLFRKVSGATATVSAFAGMSSALIASGSLLVATLTFVNK